MGQAFRTEGNYMAHSESVLSNWSHSFSKRQTQPGGVGCRLASLECRLLEGLINVCVQTGRHALSPLE